MIKNKIFWREFRVTVIAAIAIIFIGILTSVIIFNFFKEKMGPGDPGGVFFAKLIDSISENDRSAAILKIYEMSGNSMPFKFLLLDERGNVVFPTGESQNVDRKKIEQLDLPYAQYQMSNPNFSGGPPASIIRLKGMPIQYLYVGLNQKKFHGPGLGIFVFTLISLFISIFIGVGLSLYLFFRSLRKKVILADSVISELQKGNLKVRFPISSNDEIAQFMMRFNRMADEIEQLVEQLRIIEKSRINLFQELAHDLRTPIASLKNLLETLHEKSESLSGPIAKELLSLSTKEVDYLDRLGEDFLLLAQASGPHYRSDDKKIVISDLLDDEIENVAAMYNGKVIRLKKDLSQSDLLISGDIHLIRRLFRNALNNAFSFCKSEVSVKLEPISENFLEISIIDDGPGLSEIALKSFGERKSSRIFGESSDGRLSMGLGSIIMKAVAKIHQGEIRISNRFNESNIVLGASLLIRLPMIKSDKQ